MEHTKTEHADIKEMVKEKYGQAALRAGAGGSSCCGSAPASGARLRSDHFESVRCGADGSNAGESAAGFARAAAIRRHWRN